MGSEPCDDVDTRTAWPGRELSTGSTSSSTHQTQKNRIFVALDKVLAGGTGQQNLNSHWDCLVEGQQSGILLVPGDWTGVPRCFAALPAGVPWPPRPKLIGFWWIKLDRGIHLEPLGNHSRRIWVGGLELSKQGFRGGCFVSQDRNEGKNNLSTMTSVRPALSCRYGSPDSFEHV